MDSALPAAPATNRLLVRFLAVAVTLYLVWFFGYEQWLIHDGRLDMALCDQVTQSSVYLLKAVGFDAAISPARASLLQMNGHDAVVVGPPCNGLVLYALFTGFIIAFPGSWRHKLWYIPAGCFGIWVLNVIRVAALGINHAYFPDSLNFNHHYTYTFIVYAFMFGLWMLWAKRLANDAATASPAPVVR